MTRAMIFFPAVGGFFALLVLFNGQHLGANASLHWDASTCIMTVDPMPDRAMLEQNRRHIFDIARESGSSDPAAITRQFLAPENLPRHAPLETVRRYYSQIAYWFARGAFNLGAHFTHSATGAVVFFQLESALAIAIAFALLFTDAVMSLPRGTRNTFRLVMIGLIFLTIASEPVFLSLSRQMLTETAGFFMLAPALLLLRAAINPSSQTGTAILLAAMSAGFCFLTIRARYTLGPAMLVLFPLILLLSVPLRMLPHRRRHFIMIAFTLIAVFAALSAIDIDFYGPFIFPWIYDEVLVRSTRLYFHTDPPYEPFWVMIYVNLPLLLLPLVGIGCWQCSPSARIQRPAGSVPGWQIRLAAVYAAAALLLLLAPIALMARQQVSFQPRHLFAFSAIYVSMLLLAMPHIRWRWFTASPLIAICLIVLTANIYSTIGPQRTSMASPWPNTIAGILRDRSIPGPHHTLLRDLADGYFDWSDNERVHDYLIVFRYLQQTKASAAAENKSILLIDSTVPACGTYGTLVTRFNQPFIWWNATAHSHATELRAIQLAIDSHAEVYLITPSIQPNPLWHDLDIRPTRTALNAATLFRVAGVKKPPRQ